MSGKASPGETTPATSPNLMPAWQPGQSGNPAGRPKGSRHKLGEDFLKALLADFDENGIQAIKDMRDKNPADYVKVVASILPKEIEAGERTLDMLGELLARIDGRTRSILPALPAPSQETAH